MNFKAMSWEIGWLQKGDVKISAELNCVKKQGTVVKPSTI